MIRLTYDPALVEEAVLLSEPAASHADARTFRRERNRVYDIADPDRREAAFQALHGRWFARLRLHEIVEQVVAERPGVADRLGEGRALRAMTRREEGADLVDQLVAGEVDQRPILVLRLRPATLFEPEVLRARLRHELMHVADMLDPAFGYQRSLPLSYDGPSGDNIVRDRYRVLWDVTIDGRLARTSQCGAGPELDATRDARWREFAGAFAGLGDDCRRAFEEWFSQTRPTHAHFVEFALDPLGTGTVRARTGRCPLCRFPIAALDPRLDLLSAGTIAFIRDHHPSWDVDHGLCPQCLDLYEARYRETCDGRCR